MTVIRDAQTHSGARVDDEGQLSTVSVSLPEDRHINVTHQEVWSLPFGNIDPIGIDDYFFYFKNTGIVDIIFTDFRGATTVAGHVNIEHVTGTPSYTADVDIVPVNRYLGSSNLPTATIKTDTDITGLTSSGVIFRIDAATVGQTNHLQTTAGIVVPPGQALAMRWGEATGILSGVVSIAARD